MENVKDKERQKREAEQLALEAQIQPHFIYNTINSITYVAHLKGDKEIEDISRATVELLRGVLGVRESYIPLWQECEYIKQYTKIQRFKTNNDFVVRWEVEQELWTYMLPKLLLQPIVENAVLHGIYHQVDAVIEIQVTRMNDRVILRITDNGKGISPKQLDDIRHGTMEGAKMRSVGLSNVRSRIKAIYGSSYDMEISSVEGSFTSVVINLPASFEGDFDYVE